MKPTPEQEKLCRHWMDAVEWAMNHGAPTAVPPQGIGAAVDNGVDFSAIFQEYGRCENGFGLLPNYWEIWKKRWAARKAS